MLAYFIHFGIFEIHFNMVHSKFASESAFSISYLNKISSVILCIVLTSGYEFVCPCDYFFRCEQRKFAVEPFLCKSYAGKLFVCLLCDVVKVDFFVEILGNGKNCG